MYVVRFRTKLIACMWISYWLHTIWLNTNFSQSSWLNIISFPLNLLDNFVKNQLIINVMTYFWDPRDLHLCVSILRLVSYWLEYYSFVVNFEMGKYTSSKFNPFQDCFWIFWVPHIFPHEFLITLSFSAPQKRLLKFW